MELLKHEQLQGKYLNMNETEVDVTYDVFTLATQPGLADKAAQEAQKTMKVQGFRPGKTPRSIIEKRLGTHNLYGNVLSPIWDEFCLENHLVAGYRAELDDIHARIDGAIVFKVITMLFPVLELNMRDKYVVDVTSDVINKTAQQLQTIRNKHTKTVAVEDRATIWGDIVTLDFTGSVNGQEDADLCAKNATVEIGARQIVIPGFEEAIVDIAKDSTKEFTLAIPEDFATRLPNHPRAPYLAGRTVVFTATVTDIKTKQIPNDVDLPALENKANYTELYHEIAHNVFEDIKKNMDDICSRASNDIIIDNEDLMLKSVQAPLVESRVLNFIDKNKQYFDQMNATQREEQLKRIVPSLTKSVYQDVIYSYLLAHGNMHDIKPSEEEINTEAEKIAAQAYMQSQGKVKHAAEKERLLKQEYFSIYRSVQRRKAYLLLREKIDVQLNESNEEYIMASTLSEEITTENDTKHVGEQEAVISESAKEQA